MKLLGCVKNKVVVICLQTKVIKVKQVKKLKILLCCFIEIIIPQFFKTPNNKCHYLLSNQYE